MDPFKRDMMPLFLFLTLFLNLAVWAQHSEQPAKEDTTDLRAQSVLFSMEDVAKKKVLWLERTANLDYFLRLKEDKEEVIRKLASREGAKLDREFASRFLKCQYEIESPAGDCQVTLRLTMKGESQDICVKDEKKAQEIVPFMSQLEKRF
jgi:hypothetical protein